MNNNDRKTALLLAALSAASLAAGGCMLSVEAEVPEIEVTRRDVSFEGVPAVGLLGDVSMTRSFTQKHPALDLPEGLTSEVRALDVTLTAKSGITSLDFIHFLRVSMNGDNAGGAAPVQLVDYERHGSAPVGGVLTMASAYPVNTLDHWKTEEASFTLEIAGMLPAQAWTADVTVRFSGKVQYKYER